MQHQLESTIEQRGVEAAPRVSVVCPFYNEALILEEAIESLLNALKGLPTTWELIVVNDGSTDGSKEIALSFCDKHPSLRVLSYPSNRGRGYAIRTGARASQGAIIVTTEIDLSWGEDIVSRLVAAMDASPEVDIMVASPHIPGGGYRNVPPKRVFFSKFGNWVIRACVGNTVSMNTGMTRAYRAHVLSALPLYEDEKEFHLEVILKAKALGFRFGEIPSLLEWKSYKTETPGRKRKSSSRVKKLVLSHSLFSLFANPVRYAMGLAFLTMITGGGFLLGGVYRFLVGDVAAFALIIGLTLAVIALLLAAFGVIAQQGNMVQSELWRLQSEFKLQSDGWTRSDRMALEVKENV
ncbi:MAG: glycosyltransferase family 2 protein [Pseudomonadales bacterium]